MPITSTDLLAKLTAAVMADAALSEQVRAYEEDTFESFLVWLRTEGIEVVDSCTTPFVRRTTGKAWSVTATCSPMLAKGVLRLGRSRTFAFH